MQAIQDKLIARVYGKGRGWAFSKKDFVDQGSDASIRQALNRLEKEGTIRRVMRGIYDYPEHSAVLDRTLSPHFDQVAKAIARNRGWTIHPSGAAALNLLGLSTQVPGKIVYLSDGPAKTFEAGPWSLRFKSAALKDMKLRPRTSLMVQAIKSLGHERMDEQTVAGLRNAFSPAERNQIRKDAAGVAGWVYEWIRDICAEEGRG